jgi:NCS2 family nucleobase:cation symporter-2
VFTGLLSRLAVLIGIVIGTAVAAGSGRADFSTVTEGAYVALPPVLHFGSPTFHLGAIVSMTVVMLVIMTETTADILAVGEIIQTEVDERRVADGLRADMLSTTVSPLLGSFPCSAFAQNVGLVALTRVRSRYVVAVGGVLLVVFGLLPVVGRVVAAIPYPVLGGAGIVLFGSVAASGVKTLSQVAFEGNLNLLVVATALGAGMVPVAAPEFWADFPEAMRVVLGSGISAAAVTAVLLNLVFNEVRPRHGTGAPEGPTRRTRK